MEIIILGAIGGIIASSIAGYNGVVCFIIGQLCLLIGLFLNKLD